MSISDSVTIIGDFAFAENFLNSVTITESVLIIGEYAFWNNSLTSVTILGDELRFNDYWNIIGFPEILKPH